MRAARRIACIAMLIITVGVTVDVTAASASAGNVLVDAYKVSQSEGLITASILRSMGYKVTLLESRSYPRELPELSKYSAIWELHLSQGFTATEQQALEAYVRQGGRLYLNGQGGNCCEQLNEGDQAIARNLLKDREIAIGGEPESSEVPWEGEPQWRGKVAANSGAEDGITTEPNPLATIPAEGAGKIKNIPEQNVLADTESGAIAGAFDEKDMLNGKGRLVIDMSLSWLGGEWHEYPLHEDTEARLRRSRLEVIENIQDFLRKTPERQPAPSAEYVALGDSLSSGIGSYSYLPGTTEGKACYQATDGYVESLAAETGLSLNFQACKDATVARLSTGNNDQLRAVGPNTKLVTLSLGGTELGMRSVIERCLKGHPSQGSTDGCFEANNEAVQTALAWLRNTERDPGTYRLPGNKKTEKSAEPLFYLALLDALVVEQAPDAKLVVIGYPKLLETGQEHATACDITGGAGSGPKTLDAAGVEWVNQQIDALDELIQADVGWARGWAWADIRFVDPRPAFAGHGLCDTGESFINPFVAEPHTPVTPESLNPTARGQEELKRLISEAINE
jgi:hypothetical protein